VTQRRAIVALTVVYDDTDAAPNKWAWEEMLDVAVESVTVIENKEVDYGNAVSDV
jgi:hypothetical protein